MNNAYTLQINLSPGDVRYAEQTVPALVQAHPDAAEKLLIVDVCKPQRTGIVDPEKRFPEPAYAQRVKHVREIADNLLRQGVVDRVETLEPGNQLIEQLSMKYLGGVVRETHDYGGCALMSYLAAFELCRTPWLAHFDADILIHQAANASWVRQAIPLLEANPQIVAASPLSSPPVSSDQGLPSKGEKLAHLNHEAGWLSHWFSTRCFLFDLNKLAHELPLLQGRILWETRLVKWFKRGYPRSPEIMLFRRMEAAKKYRLMLKDQRTWLLHPVEKGDDFIGLLPELIETVNHGRFPATQAGQQDILTEAWKRFPFSSGAS